jgi:hypothetical protein
MDKPGLVNNDFLGRDRKGENHGDEQQRVDIESFHILALLRFSILRAAEKRPSAALSGRLTVLAAWQKVTPYSL